jgi:hypothetical protein
MLVLRDGIAQGVPSTATILWFIVRPHLSCNHSWFIYQNSLAVTRGTPSSEAGRNLARKVLWILPTKCLFLNAQDSLSCRKILRHGADGFIFPSMEVVLLIFLALKTYLPRSGFNVITLGSMASTVTTRPSRLTLWTYIALLFAWIETFTKKMCRIGTSCVHSYL